MPADPEPAPPVLIEGVDYYVERGRWVFTAAYHRKRGYCCQSGCRHCPYPGNGPASPAAGQEREDAT